MEKYIKHEDLFNFKDRTYDNGIETLNLSSWEQFLDVVKIFNISKDYYIWRGQRKDWQLISKFDRGNYSKGFVKLFERNEMINRLIKKFKSHLIEIQDMEALHPDFNSLKNNAILGIGQHNGLITPLLDWTEDPYIAAYFAFYEKDINQQCDRVIYALNKDLQRYIHVLKIKNAKKKVISKEKNPFVSFPDLKGIKLDKRIERQKGLFSQSLDGLDVKENVLNYTKRYPKKNNEIILAKIFIPNKFQRKSLKFLKDNNITHGYLFPDYAGAVEICKIDMGLDI